jgi:hypothetical protein
MELSILIIGFNSSKNIIYHQFQVLEIKPNSNMVFPNVNYWLTSIEPPIPIIFFFPKTYILIGFDFTHKWKKINMFLQPTPGI